MDIETSMQEGNKPTSSNTRYIRNNNTRAIVIVLLSLTVLWALLQTDVSNLMANLSIEQRQQHQQQQQQKQQRNEICTAELLLEESKTNVVDATVDTDASVMGSNDTNTKEAVKNTTKQSLGWKYSKDAGEWRWLVPDRGQRACGLLSLKMLQSMPHDIHATLSGKWLLMIGDSSVRMLHDYLVGRWLGGYTHWPKQMSNYGPKEHTRPCQGDFASMKNNVPFQPFACTYDVFWRGARVTFVWFALDLSEELRRTVRKTVGSPDVVVA